MKSIYDDNFLGGQLTITVCDDVKHTILGEFRFYDYLMDDFFTFTARTRCHKNDNFSENKGVELVKSKLARTYHKMYMNQFAEVKRELERQLSYVNEEYEFRKKKVLNIEKDLKEHFDLTFYRNKKKAVKKTATKKNKK